MINEIEKVDGVKMAASLDSIIGPTYPTEEMLPDKVKDMFENGDYQMMLISSEYQTASDEVNDQITELNKIVKSYSNDAMLIGEAPCTKDLINITDTDFKRVSAISIIAIFVIILLVFKSISLPIILVAVIEFAIFVNMGIPGFTGTKASVYRKHCNRYHPAWSDGRLCDTYDYKIQKEQIHGNGETASDHKGSSRLNDVDHCQRTLLLRSNIRCRTLFKHRHDKLDLYTSCKRRNYQYVCSYTGITFNVHDI